MRDERTNQLRQADFAKRTPATAFLYGLDILVRTYLVFLGKVVPHKLPEAQAVAMPHWGGLMPRRDIKATLLILAVVGGSALPSRAQAQFPWRTLSTPGYAVGGLVAAAGPAFAANSIESGVTVFGVGLAGGALAGWMVGSAAEKRLARNEALPGWHKNALRTGTVLTGAGVGALASFLVINADGGGGEGAASDEAIFGSFIAGGAVMGALTQVLLESRLEPGPARTGLGLGPGGQPALVLTLDF